uniref:Uncharacterized protein n=1 Tax=Schistosoma mansoni TaxID=6183 RepID=A0A5K4F703_SCHMA
MGVVSIEYYVYYINPMNKIEFEQKQKEIEFINYYIILLRNGIKYLTGTYTYIYVSHLDEGMKSNEMMRL